MTRFYDIDAANAAVPELDGIVEVLAEQRAELVRLRDEVLAAGSGAGDGATTAVADRSSRPGAADPAYRVLGLLPVGPAERLAPRVVAGHLAGEDEAARPDTRLTLLRQPQGLGEHRLDDEGAGEPGLPARRVDDRLALGSQDREQVVLWQRSGPV